MRAAATTLEGLVPRRRTGRLATWAFVATLVGSRLSISAAFLSAGQSERKEVRVPGAGIQLGGILFRPSVEGPRPAIVLLHGFQPAGTNGAALLEPLATALTRLGYVTLALSMRG